MRLSNRLSTKIFSTLFGVAALLVASFAPTKASAALAEFTCDPVHVKEYPGQYIVVACRYQLTINGSGTNVWWIGYPANAAGADRFVSNAHAAMLSGKHFFAYVDTAASTGFANCPAPTCRPLASNGFFGLWQP